jgi:hypothetical protein
MRNCEAMTEMYAHSMRELEGDLRLLSGAFAHLCDDDSMMIVDVGRDKAVLGCSDDDWR